MKDVQTLGRVHAYHPLDIDLLAEAVDQHYICNTEQNLQAAELDLRNPASKGLKGPFITRLKEPLWMARE